MQVTTLTGWSNIGGDRPQLTTTLIYLTIRGWRVGGMIRGPTSWPVFCLIQAKLSGFAQHPLVEFPGPDLKVASPSPFQTLEFETSCPADGSCRGGGAKLPTILNREAASFRTLVTSPSNKCIRIHLATTCMRPPLSNPPRACEEEHVPANLADLVRWALAPHFAPSPKRGPWSGVCVASSPRGPGNDRPELRPACTIMKMRVSPFVWVRC